MSNTLKIQYSDIPERNPDIERQCVIDVFDGDCFKAAEASASAGESPAIHNFANNTRPGGPSSTFYEDGRLFLQARGANTQEDQIIRKYHETLLLPKALYPIIPEKGQEALLYSLGPPFPIITLPSEIAPNLLKSSIRETMTRRLHVMFYIGWKEKHTIITGLWGCGAFNTDPFKMAELWEEAIRTAPYLPPKIVFAIITDSFSAHWGPTVVIANRFSQIKL
jgi:hypothetical protein